MTATEQVILVDENDHQIGTAEKFLERAQDLSFSCNKERAASTTLPFYGLIPVVRIHDQAKKLFQLANED
jgi:hypothetical protein